MTFYHHWFEEFVNSKNIRVHFFSNEGSFLHLFDSLDIQIELNFIELCLAIRITFEQIVAASQMTEIRSITSLFITCYQVIGLLDHAIR